jgi:hypothetical protein
MNYAKRVKSRIRILVVADSLVVALAFGLSFYFGFIATESAIASRVPELADVVSTMKNVLLSNTLVFVAVIIGSFYVLSILVTERMFKPLDSLREDLETFAEGRLPTHRHERQGGPFESLEASYVAARNSLDEREQSEIAELVACIELAGPSHGVTERLQRLLDEKGRFAGEAKRSAEKTAKADDSIFMQPV